MLSMGACARNCKRKMGGKGCGQADEDKSFQPKTGWQSLSSVFALGERRSRDQGRGTGWKISP